MDLSDLLSLLQRFGTVFPIFSIKFPFHIAYDVIIRLASSWILEDAADDLASLFNGAFGAALRYMYESDQAFMKMCRDMWNATAGFALALLPLMLILSIFSTVKNGASSSFLTIVKSRELAFGTIVNVGLGVSSFWIFTKVLSVSTGIGKQMLAISGISVTTDFTDIASRIFLPMMLTVVDGSSEALLVVLMFLRLFLKLVLFLSIVLVSVSTRIGILLLFGISPVCFVLSVYEEFDWLRTSWIKTFLGFILTPVVDGILLALIMLNNEKFMDGMSMGEVFRTLCMSIGIACLIVILHSEVIKRIFDSIIADFRKAVRAIKTVAQIVAKIYLSVQAGGASAVAGAGGKTAEKAAGMKEVENEASKEKNDSKDKQEKKADVKKESGIEKNFERIRERNQKRYELRPEEMAKAGAAAKTVIEAMDEISRREYGCGLNTAVRKGMRQTGPVRKYFDQHGGAAGIIAADLMDRAGQSFFIDGTPDQQPEVRSRDDTDRHRTDSAYSELRHAADNMGVDPSYFPDQRQDDGGYEDCGSDTFRNLNDVARRGMDIALRGGSAEEVRDAMQHDFARKRQLGFDMDFENYLIGKFEAEVKKANE